MHVARAVLFKVGCVGQQHEDPLGLGKDTDSQFPPQAYYVKNSEGWSPAVCVSMSPAGGSDASKVGEPPAFSTSYSFPCGFQFFVPKEE